jgi:hypothetical protein
MGQAGRTLSAMKPTPNDEWCVIQSMLPAGWREAACEHEAFRRARYITDPGVLLRVLLFRAVNDGGLGETVAQLRASQVASLSQVARRRRGDVRVEVGGVEREDIRRQLEPARRRPRHRQLRLLQVPVGHLPGRPIKRVACEGRRRQARHPGHTALQKPGKVALGRRRARALDGDRDHDLAHRRPAHRPWQPAGRIDGPHQVELLRHPEQRPDIADALGARRPRAREIDRRGRVRRPEDGLAGERALPGGIPERLGGDAVPMATDRPLEDIRSFIETHRGARVKNNVGSSGT